MVKRRATLDPATFRTFGELLRYLRERASLSQRELAQQVGYHYSYMSRLEKNVRTPDTLILRTRFIPALRIENDPAWVNRLLELASEGTQEQESKTGPAPSPKLGSNLPVSLTPLLGRESESAALIQVLLSEEVRLVTLIGPPGVGKTRLALHVAEQLAPKFPDGAIFVDLMPILDPMQVIPELAAVLGAQETFDASVVESVKSALQGRSLLIVMDNFEQVLDAAPQLMPLLRAVPGVKILATSREALRLRGEQEFPLTPLAVPGAQTSTVLDYPSVQLFVQRARAAQPDFNLNEQDALRVAEICRRLDGLPLAIELAAARVRIFSPADMLEQFERRFEWLANTGRDIPEWRRTLWSAIAWSYNLLTEKERTLFTRLSVFAGGWTVEAAEAVCCEEGVCPRGELMSMLMQLVDKSLVVAEAGMRYRFLDTIARFAHEKLVESGGLQERSIRHLRYFADWAEALEVQFNRVTPLTFQTRTGVEQNNLRAALEWALHHPESYFDGLRLSIPASLIWLEHGQIREEYERAQFFLRGVSESGQRPLHARLLLRTAALGSRIGQGELAFEYCLQAESIARDLGESKLLADALLMLGDMQRDWGKFDAAEKYLSECVALYRQLDLPAELDRSLTSIGNNLYHQGRYAESDAALDEALEIARRIQDAPGLGYALRIRAGNLRYVGKYVESLEAFKSALNVARANGDRPNAGVILANLCIMANLLEDYPASEGYAAEAISVFHSLGDEDQQAFPKRMRAYALLQMELPTRARTFALESLRMNLDAGTQGFGTLPCLTALTEIKLTEGKLEPVARLYGFLAPRIRERYAQVSPDSRSFERIERALAGKGTEAWQAEGESMTLEDAVTLASRWNPPRGSSPKPRPSMKIKRSR